jgi:hypothetical protein
MEQGDVGARDARATRSAYSAVYHSQGSFDIRARITVEWSGAAVVVSRIRVWRAAVVLSRYYSDICLEGLTKTTNNLSQNI